MRVSRGCLLILFLVSVAAAASKTQSVSLDQLVGGSDHVFQVTITAVDMIDDLGRMVDDPNAATGPGLPNTIRLHAEILPNGVLKTNLRSVPNKVVVGLWRLGHQSLGDAQELFVGNELIILLVGDSLHAVSPGNFRRPLDEKAEILRLLNDMSSGPRE